MRFAISTCVWKRPEIFALFAKGIHTLIESFPHIKFDVIVAGSEGLTSETMVKEAGFHYIEVPNKPLGNKFNATLKVARTMNPDYVLCLGSDDIISPELFAIYLDKINRHGVDYMGVTDFYFYDPLRGKALYWGGYTNDRAGDFCGAGTVLSPRILDIWDWRAWAGSHNRGLDRGLHHKIKQVPHRRISISLKEEGVFAVDLKSRTNLTPLQEWPNSEWIDPKILLEQFKYLPLGNTISDFAHVDPNVVIGENNIIMEGAIVRAGVILGNNNYIGPYCIIGDLPEKGGWFDKPAGVYISNNNRFTKQVTIDSGTTHKTYIGDNNLFLKNSHLGHDVQVGHNNVFSCNSLIGGFTRIESNSNFGLGAAVHQRLSIPEGVMIGMNSTVTKTLELKPYRKYAGSPARDIGSNEQHS